MDGTGKTTATNVNEFEPSLWHFIGQLKTRYALTALLDQIDNDRMMGRSVKNPVVLIAGANGMGKRTLARALHNAAGNLVFRETALVLGTSEDHCEFFRGAPEFTTFYIPNFTKVSTIVAGALAHIIRDRYFIQPATPWGKSEVVSVKNKLIVLSADSNHAISEDFLKYIGIRCNLTGYSKEQIYEILKQLGISEEDFWKLTRR